MKRKDETYSCGHKSTLVVTEGSATGVSKFIRWTEDKRNLCWACWNKKEAEK